MNELFAVDDATCRRLAAEVGSPAFVYSRASARRSWLRLREAMPPRVRIAYAVKANPHPALLETFAALGSSFDCASIGELDRVAALGLPEGRIFFAGPGKRDRELARAVELNARVQAEGFEDLERLDRLARGPLSVNLRVHPRAGIEERNRIIGGTGPSAFGIDEEELPAILSRARSLERLAIRGLHVFAASNERDVERLLATHRAVFALGKGLQEALGSPLEQIDLGGGLGIPYDAQESPLDVAALGRGLARLLDENRWFLGELVIEPGRFLAGPAGVYLARVIRTKESRGTRFAILEGGINHLMRPHLTGQAFPVRVAGREGGDLAYTLAGPLCTSLDRLGEHHLPPLQTGDLLVFGCAGAYGFSEGMTHFLSHPVPPEIVLSD